MAHLIANLWNPPQTYSSQYINAAT